MVTVSSHLIRLSLRLLRISWGCLEVAYVSTQLELEEAVAEAEYRLAAAAREDVFEGADVSTRLDGGDPEGYAEYCRMAADAGFI